MELPVAVPEHLAPADRERLAAEAEALGPWAQGPFPLGGDLVVNPGGGHDRRWDVLAPLLGDEPVARALDVAAGEGFDAFMLRLRGAGDVQACERDERALARAAFLERRYATGVRFEPAGWEHLHPAQHGRFDLVHCRELLFQARDPLALLARLRGVTADGGRLALATMTLASDSPDGAVRFAGGRHGEHPGWWWIPDAAALAQLLAAAGFAVESQAAVGPGPAGPFATELRYAVARATGAAPDPGVVTHFPAGHFYSPVPDPAELTSEPRRSQIWTEPTRPAAGVDWRAAEQHRLCTQVFARQERLRFAPGPTGDPAEYHMANGQYPVLDAWALEAMLRHLRPRRMIEVGSGFSSLVTARVNREHLGGTLHFTCIEPYPREFLAAGVEGIAALRTEQVQDTPLAVFDALGAGDVLFIDTSHTVKTGGDVTFLFTQVLPRLAPGVVVHAHDIFLPGDYPEPWVAQGWGWNETYLVHAFLAFSSAYEVVLGMRHLLEHDRDALRAAFPDAEVDTRRGASALWIRRRATPA